MPVRSSGSVRIFYPAHRREALVAYLRERVEELSRRLPLRRVVLFGSWAKGRATARSDVDLLVVYAGPTRADAYRIVWETLHIRGLEPHVLSEEEAEALRPTLARMVRGGVDLLEGIGGEDAVQGAHVGPEEARRIAETCARVLRERLGARAVYVVGSAAGESPWHSRSDLDLVVEGLPSDRYLEALSTLWDLLPEGLDLDLIPLEEAPPELVARVRGEGRMPEDPKAALRKEVADELANLDRLAEQAKTLLQQLPASPTFIEAAAAGKLVHDFYTGVERIFERIAVRLGPGLPAGPNWHTWLLRGMEREVEGIRPAVIDHLLALRLLDYLRFRHLFRHGYGYELQWEKLEPLLRSLPETLEEFRRQLAHFLEALKRA
jgi:predicted nucleotidyltransferase